jgi:hypothetical protein
MSVACEKSNLALQEQPFWQNEAKIINVFNAGQSIARLRRVSSKSLARNEASGRLLRSASREYRGTPHGRFFRAGLAVERGFGGSVHEKRMNAVEHMTGSALFLDRDGVINVDRGYVRRLDQFEFVPGIFPLARFWADELRRPIVVVSNQSGIGRGYFDEKGPCGLDTMDVRSL